MSEPVSLRWYQAGSIDALWNALRAGVTAPLACLPTGAGKSVVVSSICRSAVKNWKGRVLVLVHVKELVAQLAEAIRRDYGDPMCPLGVLSAGLKSRSVDQITVAGIQTAFRCATDIGPRDLCLIDEAHLIPDSGDGMYRSLIADLRVINPNMRVMGLTATPYRLGSGVIYGDGKVFSDLVYDADIKRLITEGFLCRLRSKDAGAPDLSAVHTRGGEFVASELEVAMSDEDKVKHAVDEMLRHGSDRKAWLVFCCGVKHATLVSEALRDRGIENAIVTGDTPEAERDDIIAAFKAGRLRCLVNVSVLTTGFDAPHVDLVAMLRPTESPGLYYQMMGRGFRISPAKQDCLVLDMAGNIQRHGPIDTLNERMLAPKAKREGGEAPTKRCPECEEVVPAGVRQCPSCNFEFPPPEVARHDTRADTASPISEDKPAYWIERITSVTYEPWTKKGAAEGAPQTLCVSYYQGMQRVAREWVCVEHPMGGFAHNKAMDWIRDRIPSLGLLTMAPDGSCMVLETPDGEICLSAVTAAEAGKSGHFREPRRIQVKPDGKYLSIVGHDLADGPEPTTQRRNDVTTPPTDDEPPF